MAKTVFSAGDKSLGTKGTKVTAAFLNALQNHRHDGLDQDGSAPIDYAVDTGAANAYAIALTPALAAHVVGLPIAFKAANANTSAATIAINGLAPVVIKKNATQALAAGDIAAGQLVLVVYDGTYYQLVNNGQAVDLGQFGKSQSTVGYQKLPNGLIIQWGVASGSSSYTLGFPIAFPTACLAVAATCLGAGTSAAAFAEVGTTTTTGTTIYAMTSGGVGLAQAQTRSVNWIAIGY